MAIMLQRNHFERVPFDDNLSKKILKQFIETLDSSKLFFLQEDIDRFNAEYSAQLDDLILTKKTMLPAEDIYKTFRTRLKQRVEFAESLLKEPKFDFDKDESTMLDREKAPWPKDLAEANEIWRLEVKKAVLTETLRRKAIEKTAQEKGEEIKNKEKNTPEEKMLQRYQRIAKNYDTDDLEDIADYFLSAVALAYDPHTEFMSTREVERFQSSMSNSLVGIGAVLRAEEDGATKIDGIVVGGPADKGGDLQLKDRIVAVDPLNTGEMVDVMFMRIDKVVELIRGKENTEVALKVEPANGVPGETKIVVIPRGKVQMKDEVASGELQIKNVDGHEKRIGYLKLPAFYSDFQEGTASCANDVELILKRLVKEGMDGLVLDLRNNGGGSLEEVRRMTGFFIDEGPVVRIKEASGESADKRSENIKAIYRGPMVVLTSKASASASEILAGALQDYNRAVVIGDSSTFGKGTVQQMMDLGRKMPLFADRTRAGFLKPTIQKFYRVSGSSTQLEGVASDIVLPSFMDAMEYGERYMNNSLAHDVIEKAKDFTAAPREGLYLEALKEQSTNRVLESKLFSYVKEDVARILKEKEENKVSLKMADRVKELEDAEKQKDDRVTQLRPVITKLQEQDANTTKAFRISMDTIDEAELKPVDIKQEDSAYMKRSEEKEEEEDDLSKLLDGFDAVKREGIAIVADLAEFTKKAAVAGVTPKAEANN